jgi:hypothetical protein
VLLKGRKGKEIENSPLSQPTSKKRRKLRFTDEIEETQAPSKPCTRSSARRFPIPTIQTKFVECAARRLMKSKWNQVRKMHILRR